MLPGYIIPKLLYGKNGQAIILDNEHFEKAYDVFVK